MHMKRTRHDRIAIRQCGLTPQYAGLESLYQDKRGQGLEVLGEDQHPLYARLTAAQPAAIGDGPFRERLKGYGVNSENSADVLWNFEKFLVSREGRVVARFAPAHGERSLTI
jgi:glutathione peroxidase